MKKCCKNCLWFNGLDHHCDLPGVPWELITQPSNVCREFTPLEKGLKQDHGEAISHCGAQEAGGSGQAGAGDKNP